MPARRILESLWQNKTIKFLNLADNRLNAADYEFGSRIGRLIQLNYYLKHLDIRNCNLSREEILYITMCLRQNDSILAIHMGLNKTDV